MPCSLLKAAYLQVPRNLMVGLRKVHLLTSRTYNTEGYSAGAGSSLAWDILEKSHVLVGKNCSKKLELPSWFVLCSMWCLLHDRTALPHTWKYSFQFELGGGTGEREDGKKGQERGERGEGERDERKGEGEKGGGLGRRGREGEGRKGRREKGTPCTSTRVWTHRFFVILVNTILDFIPRFS